MRKCETCGAKSEADWGPMHGLKHEHGVLCQACATEIAGGKAEKDKAAALKDPNKFNLPVYPPDELPKDLQKIADAYSFVGKPVTDGQGGPVIGKVLEAHHESALIVGTLEVEA